MKTYRVTRQVTKRECNWLDEPFLKDEIVYEYLGCTYGCIATGIAVTRVPNEEPFIEIPLSAVIQINDVHYN